MIDAHTHLELCEPHDSELVRAAREVGVSQIITVGTDARSGQAALRAAERFPEVLAAVGRHPNAATGFGEDGLSELAELARHERCVAIGETGLDFFREGAPAIDQERAFRAQIELARELDKPVVIHTRAAEEQTLRILEDHAAGVRVMLHCFTLADHLDRCLEHGDWWFSFAGNSTYPANAPLRAAARRVPPDRLLVETDAPYLSPQPLRGKPNQPAHVVHTAQVLAAERGMSLAALEQSVHRSAAALFGW